MNGSATPQKITSVSAPGGPFTYQGLPRPGTVLRPGQSVTVQVTYAPGQAVTSSGTLTVTGSSGASATISLSGAGTAAVSKFTAPKAVDFGRVPLGHTVTRFIHLVNAGNQGATVTHAVVRRPFGAPYQVAAGLPVNSGYDLRIPVTFTPLSSGTGTGAYKLTWTDSLGTHTLRVPVTGTGTG